MQCYNTQRFSWFKEFVYDWSIQVAEMAMLRRLDGPVRSLRAREIYATGGIADRTSDWHVQNMRIDTDKRIEVLRNRRAENEQREKHKCQLRDEQAAIHADQILQLKCAAEMHRISAEEQAKQQHSQFCRDVQIQQALTSSADLRRLQQHCLNEQATAEGALHLLRAEVMEEERRQQVVADREADQLARLQDKQEATEGEAARRAAGRKFLHDRSAEAASHHSQRQMQEAAEKKEDLAEANRLAKHMQDEDIQHLTRKQHAQAKLHAALDQLVEERKQQRHMQEAADQALNQEVKEFDVEKRAFAERLAAECKLAEESRQRVLKDLTFALRTHQLQAIVAQDLREAVANEELHVRQRQEDELRLRHSLQTKIAQIHAYRESIKILDERRVIAAEQKSRERQEMLQKLAEDEKLEQLSQQRRRMKKLDHAREVESILQDRWQRRERERQQEMDEIECRKRDEERAALIIGAERSRLLEAYGLYKSGAELHRAAVDAGVCTWTKPLIQSDIVGLTS
jgi:hypothetical protein